MTETGLAPQIDTAIETILENYPDVAPDERKALIHRLALHMTSGLKPSDVSSLIERMPAAR